VENREKHLVAMNRNGYLVLLDENHREREKYQIRTARSSWSRTARR